MITTRPSSELPVVTHIASGDLWAGAEVQVYQLCRALKQSRQIRPTAIVFNSGKLHDRLSELEIPVTLADESQLAPGKIIRAISQHLRAHKTHIVHTHGFKENILGVAAKVLSRAPYSVRTVHGNPEFNLPWYQLNKRASKLLDTLTARLGQDAIVAVSGQLEEFLRPRFGKKVHRIHNFIDVDDLRHRYFVAPRKAWPGGTLKLGLAGRLVPVKRGDLFLDTISLLRQKYKIDAQGIILGDGPLRQTLEQRSLKEGLKAFVQFKGFADPIYPELLACDALMMPSDHEGLPMILLEALALEVPIIAHNTGGIPNVLDFGRAGVLVDDHRAEGYAKALATWTTAPGQISRVKFGLKIAKAQFDILVNGHRYIDLYRLLNDTQTEFIAE